MKNEVSNSEMKGPLGELYDQCSGENGRQRFEEFKLWLKGAVNGLLAYVTTVRVPAIKRFAGSDAWGYVGVNKDGVKIAFLGKNFQEQFGNVVEENVPETELEVSRLQRYADAKEIVGAIPREKRVVRPSQIYQVVRVQEACDHSGLNMDGYNLFLACGADGNFWLVGVDRFGDGWFFDALPLGYPSRWCDGDRVFSRKSH